jgi:hypothetical protein
MLTAVSDLLAMGQEAASATRTLDLDASHPLPWAPWFEPGAM